MEQLLALLTPRFRESCKVLGDGSIHLDVAEVDPELLGQVSLPDSEQYGTSNLENVDFFNDLPTSPPLPFSLSTMALSYWIDDLNAAGEQIAALRFLHRDIDDRGVVLQIGGRGSGLVRWSAATGAPAVLLSPFASELDHGRRLAAALDCSHRFMTVRSAAENMPFQTASIHRSFSAGTMHHVNVADGLREVRRVLQPNGRFNSWDIWDSPGYRLGIRLLGKQESISCKPLDVHRIAGAVESSEISISGCGIRYLVVFTRRLRIPIPQQLLLRAQMFDDWICFIPGVRRALGSMLSIRIRGSATAHEPRRRR